MMYLILVLVVGMVYLRFQMNKEDESQEEEFDRIKSALDNAIDESPYKIEPIIVKKRTRKKTGRVRQPKKDPPKKLKVTKRKTKKKTKRKTK